jgi:hypothetical protein
MITIRHSAIYNSHDDTPVGIPERIEITDEFGVIHPFVPEVLREAFEYDDKAWDAWVVSAQPWDTPTANPTSEPHVEPLPFNVGDWVRVSPEAEGNAGPWPGQVGMVRNVSRTFVDVEFVKLRHCSVSPVVWSFIAVNGSHTLNGTPSTDLLEVVGTSA